MKAEEDKFRKDLDELFEKARTAEDLNNIRFLIDDGFEAGYSFQSYIFKYNELVRKIENK